MRKMKGKERKKGNMREGQQQIVRNSIRTRKHKCEGPNKIGKLQKQEHVRGRGKNCQREKESTSQKEGEFGDKREKNTQGK